jgi:hypothetical protein
MQRIDDGDKKGLRNKKEKDEGEHSRSKNGETRGIK